MKIRTKLLFFGVALLMAARANALILSGTAPIDSQLLSGCPDGSVAVADLKSAVSWWEGPPFGGGEYHVLFRGGEEALNEALTNFAAIHAPELDVVIHDGTNQNPLLERATIDTNTDSHLDWEFVVWNPQSWNQLYQSTNAAIAKMLKDNPNARKQVAPPRLDIYVRDKQINLEKMTMPANIRVRDERAKKQ